MDHDLLIGSPYGLSDDQLRGNALLRQPVTFQKGRALTVEDDGHPTAVLNQLGQAMRHQDDHTTGVGKGMHAPKEVARFLGRERRVGLIEQEDPGRARESTSNLGSLLHREGQQVELHVSVLRDSQLGEQRPLGIVESATHDPNAFASDQQVVAHAQVRE